jgi:hypothetical protein
LKTLSYDAAPAKTISSLKAAKCSDKNKSVVFAINVSQWPSLCRLLVANEAETISAEARKTEL